MSEDASFADGAGRPLRLMAADKDDVEVISSLLQDAVFAGEDVTWRASERRFVMLLNRFRWEDKFALKNPERVRSLLVIDDVRGVKSQGFDHKTSDMVLSLLSLDWTAGEDGAGELTLTFAGDGGIAVKAECINVMLRDVTRPYSAPSGKTPEHPE